MEARQPNVSICQRGPAQYTGSGGMQYDLFGDCVVMFHKAASQRKTGIDTRKNYKWASNFYATTVNIYIHIFKKKQKKHTGTYARRPFEAWLSDVSVESSPREMSRAGDENSNDSTQPQHRALLQLPEAQLTWNEKKKKRLNIFIHKKAANRNNLSLSRDQRGR